MLGKIVNWTVSVIDGTKHLDDSVTVIVTGISMVVATHATPTPMAIPAVTTKIEAMIETIVMTVHATSTVTAPTVIAPIPGIASMTGSTCNPPRCSPLPTLLQTQFLWFQTHLQHPLPLPSHP